MQPLSHRPKGSRAGKPKVRTGCSTCKIRKVKCDERRPVCTGCERTSRSCEYKYDNQAFRHYSGFVPIKSRDIVKRVKKKESRFTEVSLSPPSLSPLRSPNPSLSLAVSDSEQRYLSLFREQTIFNLCGYFSAPFWTRLVLQELHHEPAIKHQILALGALHKSSTAGPDDVEHHQFAVVQQSKALRTLRSRVAEGPFPIRLALIASLVLSYLEAIHGNWETSMDQIWSGVKLMKTWQEAVRGQNPEVAGSFECESKIDPEFYTVLPQLPLQLLCYLVINPISDKTFFQLDTATDVGDIPNRFNTLQEALPTAVGMTLLTLLYVRECQKIKSQTPVVFPERVLEGRESLMATIEKWHNAFRPLWRTICAKDGDDAPIGGYIFDMYMCVFATMAETDTSLTETVCDAFTTRFTHIIKVAEIILQRDTSLFNTNNSRLTFTFGIGPIMAILYVATRCRVGSLRREAINLFRRYPTRNGAWDSKEAGLVAEWVVSIEEEGMGGNGNRDVEVIGDVFIPEERRVRMHTLKWTREGDWISVECMQGVIEDSKFRKSKLFCKR